MLFFKGNSIFYYKFGLKIPDSRSTLLEHYNTDDQISISKLLLVLHIMQCIELRPLELN